MNLTSREHRVQPPGGGGGGGGGGGSEGFGMSVDSNPSTRVTLLIDASAPAPAFYTLHSFFFNFALSCSVMVLN